MTHNLRQQSFNRSIDNGTREPKSAGSRLPNGSRDPEDRALRSTSSTNDQNAAVPPSLHTPGLPESRENLEPLTISLPSPLVRQARIVVVALGTTMSKLITGLIAETVARELPAIVAELSGSGKAAK